MFDRLVSGDNHIDLTYCPPDLWSSQAPSKWKLLVPRVEELEDGLHWFVDAQDKGMWNGVGPGRRWAASGTTTRVLGRGRPPPSCGWPTWTGTAWRRRSSTAA